MRKQKTVFLFSSFLISLVFIGHLNLASFSLNWEETELKAGKVLSNSWSYIEEKGGYAISYLKDFLLGRSSVSADLISVEEEAKKLEMGNVYKESINTEVQGLIFGEDTEEIEEIDINPGKSQFQREEEERIRAEEEARRKAEEEARRRLAYVDPGSFCTVSGRYIEMDLSSQRLALCNNGIEGGPFAISSGSSYYPTPTGTYKVNSKTLRAYSAKYNLYMPYWMSFIGNAYGIHELPEYPNGYKEGQNYLGRAVSHGCVRLGVGPAEVAYNWAPVGTPVIVHR